MTGDQAKDIVTMLKAATGGRVDEDTSVYFESSLEQLEYESALSAATLGARTWRYFPSWADFREAYKGQQRAREPVGEQRNDLPVRKERMPFWVKRWAASRYLFAKFGKDQDMRWFPEQSQWVDTTTERMPDDEWVIEAERVSDQEVWKVLT